MALRNRGYSGGRGGGRAGEREPDIPQPSTKVYVGGLPPDFQCQNLYDLFSTIGHVVECTLLKGYGFVHFATPEEGERAMRFLNNHELRRGVNITVRNSRSKLCPTPGVYGQELCYYCLSPSHSYKECNQYKPELERKMRARERARAARRGGPAGAPVGRKSDGDKPADGQAETAADESMDTAADGPAAAANGEKPAADRQANGHAGGEGAEKTPEGEKSVRGRSGDARGRRGGFRGARGATGGGSYSAYSRRPFASHAAYSPYAAPAAHFPRGPAMGGRTISAAPAPSPAAMYTPPYPAAGYPGYGAPPPAPGYGVVPATAYSAYTAGAPPAPLVPPSARLGPAAAPFASEGPHMLRSGRAYMPFA